MTKLKFIYSLFLLTTLLTIFPLPTAGREASEVSGTEAITTRLDNGLQVVMIESHSAPLISVIVIINAGSAMEDYHLNGVTHMLEHMLFNGTERRTQEQLYDDVDLIGGFNNAFTTEDYTAFIMSAPSRNIETALDIQSDMLFHSSFPEEKVQKELGIIEEEIRQTMGNPGYAVNANFNNWIFSGTPYEKTVIGTIAGIKQITQDDLEHYWRIHYSPNNMRMVITGDFQPGEMLELIKQYYGEIQPQEIPEGNKTPLVPIEENQARVDYIPDVDRSIRMTFNAPSPLDDDEPAFSLLLDMMSDEVNDALGELVPSAPLMVRVEKRDHKIGSRLILSASLPDGLSEEDAVYFIMEALKRSSGMETSEEEFEALRVAAMAGHFRLAENLMSSGFYMVSDIAMWGWEYMTDGMERLESLTVDDIDALRSKYFTDPVSMNYIVRPFPESSGEGDATDAVWRSETLPNGLRVVIKQEESSRVFGMHLLIEGRSYVEPSGKEGMVELLHGMLGSYASQPDGLGTDLNRIGARIKTTDMSFIPMDDYYFDHRYSYVRFTGLDMFWRDNISVLGKLVNSDFISEQGLEKSRGGLIRGIGMLGRGSRGIAAETFRQKLYGHTPRSKPLRGTAQSLGTITVDDLKTLRDEYFCPDHMILSIVTSIDPDSIMDEVAGAFGDMEASGESVEMPDATLNGYPGEEFTIEVGGPQGYIIFAFPLTDVPEEDIIPLKALGSIISSEIAFELRERQGLAYSIGAGFSMDEDQGYFSMSMGTAPANIETAIAGINTTLEALTSSELVEKDMLIAVNSIAARMIRYRVKRENQAYYIGYDEFLGKDPARDPVEPWYAITLDDILRVRELYFIPEKGFFVIAK